MSNSRRIQPICMTKVTGMIFRNMEQVTWRSVITSQFDREKRSFNDNRRRHWGLKMVKGLKFYYILTVMLPWDQGDSPVYHIQYSPTVFGISMTQRHLKLNLHQMNNFNRPIKPFKIKLLYPTLPHIYHVIYIVFAVEYAQVTLNLQSTKRLY